MQNTEIKVWNLQFLCSIARKEQLIDKQRSAMCSLCASAMTHRLGSSIMPVSQLFSVVHNIKTVFVFWLCLGAACDVAENMQKVWFDLVFYICQASSLQVSTFFLTLVWIYKELWVEYGWDLWLQSI
jgi:hypothetical protein